MNKNQKKIRRHKDCYAGQKQVSKLENWQVAEVKRSIKSADQPDAKFISHDEVAEWLTTWGTKEERLPPKCR